MKRFTRVLIVGSLAALFTSCSTPYDPFVMSRSEIYERMNVLAMMPLQMRDFYRRDEVSARYEALITERLEAVGFKVIASEEASSMLLQEVDGFILPRIELVRAHWSGNTARWDGVTDAISGKTRGLALANSEMSGTLPALSLIVYLSNTDSENCYVGRGGIQLLAHQGEATFAPAVIGGFAEVPVSEWLVNEERDVEAVDVALSGLVNKPESER